MYGKRKAFRRVKRGKKSGRKSARKPQKLSGARPSSGLTTRANARSAFDPLPVVMKNTFKYVTHATVSTSGSANAAGSQFRMNSPYNPYVGLGGSSAQNWSLASSYYSNYLCTKCRVKLTWTDPSADGLTVGIAPRNTGQTSVVGYAIDSIQADGNVTMMELNNTGSQYRTFSKTFYPWQWITPFKSRYYNDDVFSSSTSNSPAQSPVFEIFILSQAGSTITANYRLEIDYDVILFNKKFN